MSYLGAFTLTLLVVDTAAAWLPPEPQATFTRAAGLLLVLAAPIVAVADRAAWAVTEWLSQAQRLPGALRWQAATPVKGRANRIVAAAVAALGLLAVLERLATLGADASVSGGGMAALLWWVTSV